MLGLDLPTRNWGRSGKKLAQDYAAPSYKDRILDQARERGTYDLIGRIEVTLDLKTDSYVGAIPVIEPARFVRSRNASQPVSAPDRRSVGHCHCNTSVRIRKNPVPLIALTDFQPFQYGKVDIKEFESKRHAFSRDEWIDLLMNTVGLNPESQTERQKLFVLVRLVSIAERMVHLIELGPRETGKSYGYKNLSYDPYMLSGGRATPAALFVHAGNGTPGSSPGSTHWCSMKSPRHPSFKDLVHQNLIFKVLYGVRQFHSRQVSG